MQAPGGGAGAGERGPVGGTASSSAEITVVDLVGDKAEEVRGGASTTAGLAGEGVGQRAGKRKGQGDGAEAPEGMDAILGEAEFFFFFF